MVTLHIIADVEADFDTFRLTAIKPYEIINNRVYFVVDYKSEYESIVFELATKLDSVFYPDSEYGDKYAFIPQQWANKYLKKVKSDTLFAYNSSNKLVCKLVFENYQYIENSIESLFAYSYRIEKTYSCYDKDICYALNSYGKRIMATKSTVIESNFDSQYVLDSLKLTDDYFIATKTYTIDSIPITLISYYLDEEKDGVRQFQSYIISRRKTIKSLKDMCLISNMDIIPINNSSNLLLIYRFAIPDTDWLYYKNEVIKWPK